MFNTFIFCGGKSGSSTLDITFNNHGYKAIKIHSENYYNSVYKKNISFQCIHLLINVEN